MRLATALCFQLAKARVTKRERAIDAVDEAASSASAVPDIAGANITAFDRENYTRWRNAELEQQFRDHFDESRFPGKAVLDFGCGTGYLSLLAARAGAASVDGIDLEQKDIMAARSQSAREDLPVHPRFKTAEGAEWIDYADDSFDLILCFDVVEHIMAYREIIAEWRRVLAPGGRVLIWWQPYFHPYGHHLHSKIPVPWAHVVFSKRTLSETCDCIYEMPEYKLRFWEMDGQGNPLPRRKGVKHLETLGGVNGLTIKRFEKTCRESGLSIVRREPHAFSGPKPVEVISALCTRLPVLNELFTAYMIYELEKPGY